MCLSASNVIKTCREHRKSAKSIVVGFAVFLSISLSSTASASIIRYGIEGTFDAGNLSGRSYSEAFTFDDSAKPRVLGSVSWTTELLSYSLDVESLTKHWTLVDWPMEHTFSQFIDANGFLNSIAYLATLGSSGNLPAVSEFLDDNAPNSRSKHVKWYDWPRWNTFETDSTDFDPIVTVTAVSEPSPAVILLIGMIGMIGVAGLRGRKR